MLLKRPCRPKVINFNHVVSLAKAQMLEVGDIRLLKGKQNRIIVSVLLYCTQNSSLLLVFVFHLLCPAVGEVKK